MALVRVSPLRITPMAALRVCFNHWVAGTDSGGSKCSVIFWVWRADDECPAMVRPQVWPIMPASSKELDANRFAPCRPVLAHSPMAHRPGQQVSPAMLALIPPRV